MIKLQTQQQIIRLKISKEPKKNIIRTNHPTNIRYATVLRGKAKDTKELNINLKTMTIAYLRLALIQNELNETEQVLLENYTKMAANFASLEYLFHQGKESEEGESTAARFDQAREKMRKMCLSYYRSTDFVKQFITSKRMHIKNKLIVLKYLTKIEEKVSSKGLEIGWKSGWDRSYRI